MKFIIIVLAVLAVSLSQAVNLGINIPDQSGSVSGVDWSAKNINLIDIDDQGYTLGATGDDKYGRLTIVKVTLKATADIAYGYKVFGKSLLSDSTSVSISASADSFNVDFDFGIKSGKPFVSVMGCDLDLKNIDIVFTGGQSRIYNLFLNMFKSFIKSPLEDAVCKYLTKLKV